MIDSGLIFSVHAVFISATSDFLSSSSRGLTNKMFRSTLLGLCVLSAVYYCSSVAPAVAAKYNPCAAHVQKFTNNVSVTIKAAAGSLVKSAPTAFDDLDFNDYDPVEAKKIYPFEAYVEKYSRKLVFN